MGRMIGYMANRTDRLRDALHQEREAIAIGPNKQPVGWGVGFYQGGEVLHKKRPHVDQMPMDYQSIAADLKSDCVLIHVREATVGDYRAENTHPFRMRGWLFAHSGTVDRFDAIRPRLIETMPDFLRRNIRGETDSEHIFHTIAAFLHDSGHLDSPDDDDKAVMSGIRSAVALLDRFSEEVGAKPGTLNFLLTNGRRMYALRRGLPMQFVERSGIHDPRESQPAIPITPASAFRYVMIASDGNDTQATGFHKMEDNDVLIVDRSLRVTKQQL